MSYGTIYLAADISNGKTYCGQETGGPFSRMQKHLKSKKNVHFHNALQIRPESFVWMLLCECENQVELDAAEIYYGEMFDCLHPQGYCLRLGHGRGRVSNETRERQRKIQTEIQNSPEARKRNSEAQKKRYSDQKARQLTSEAVVKANKRQEVRATKSRSAKLLGSSYDIRQTRSENQKNVWLNEDYRKRMTESYSETNARLDVKHKRSVAQKARRERERQEKYNE